MNSCPVRMVLANGMKVLGLNKTVDTTLPSSLEFWGAMKIG